MRPVAKIVERKNWTPGRLSGDNPVDLVTDEMLKGKGRSLEGPGKFKVPTESTFCIDHLKKLNFFLCDICILIYLKY